MNIAFVAAISVFAAGCVFADLPLSELACDETRPCAIGHVCVDERCQNALDRDGATQDVGNPRDAGQDAPDADVRDVAAPDLNAPDTTVLPAESVAIIVTVRDSETNLPLDGARVLLFAAEGGPLRPEERVSVAWARAAATVTQVGHSFTGTGHEVLIAGADQPEYNRLHIVEVISPDAYTFPVSGAAATGEITSAAVVSNQITGARRLVFSAPHVIRQPSGSAETELNTTPTTSLELRLDMDLKSIPNGRIVAGSFIDGGGDNEFSLSIQTDSSLQLFGSGFPPWESEADFWEVGRHQYRIVWEGTMLSIYKRDSLWLPLSSDIGWTLHDQNLSMADVTSIEPHPAPFRLVERFVHEGWSAVDWYGFRYVADGVLESAWQGGAVALNETDSTFVDEQAHTWTWMGPEPSQLGEGAGIATGVLEHVADQPFVGTIEREGYRTQSMSGTVQRTGFVSTVLLDPQ